MARLLSNFKDNCKYNQQIVQTYNMDHESILYCKQAMDKLLADAGLVSPQTLNSNINFIEQNEPAPLEGSENGDDLEEIQSHLKKSAN